MFKTYLEVRHWLEDFIPLVYGKEELGLLRVENLLHKLGNPEKKFKSIHIGGTAGKGSTAFYIARLLQFSENSENSESRKTLRIGRSDKSDSLKIRNTEYSEFSDLKIGLHVSPHLVDIRERMQINGELMQLKRFIGLAGEISAVVEDIKRNQPHLIPSYFEILVAMSFLYFAEEKVDWAVLEVGLGGRLDATNVLQPEISVITNVGLDHTEILGDTVEKIAAEKSGIIKKNVPVVTGASGKALEVIKERAKSKNALLIKLDTQGELKTAKFDLFRSINKQYYSLRSPSSSFALQNQNLALATVLSLGTKFDTQTVKKAFSKGFPGRFEEVSNNVILDGAHNTDKMKSLIHFVRNPKLETLNKNVSFGNAKQIQKFKIQNSKTPARHPELDSGSGVEIVLVVAFKKGKNWKKIVNLLLKTLQIKEVIVTEYQAVTDTGKGSAVVAEEIAEYLRIRNHELRIKVIKNSQEAVFEAINSTDLSNYRTDQLILVTGSLYLVGEVRTLWRLPEF